MVRLRLRKKHWLVSFEEISFKGTDVCLLPCQRARCVEGRGDHNVESERMKTKQKQDETTVRGE